jgi:hypothetical protein
MEEIQEPCGEEREKQAWGRRKSHPLDFHSRKSADWL